MKATLTPGEQLFTATNSLDFWMWLVEKKESEKKEKAAKKAYWDAKYIESAAKNPQPIEQPIIIAADAPKYSHNRFGIGTLVCEDEQTITLSFDGKIKKMVKKFTILTLI